MKVGIITIFDPKPNYGNKLQNYAVHKVLLEMNIKSNTLYVERQQDSLKSKIKYTINSIIGHNYIRDRNRSKYNIVKKKKFKEFNEKYIPNKYIQSFDNLAEQYDYFIIGSDQVWNPNWYDDMKKKAYLLTFAKPNQKICFSPSFGVETLPDKWTEYFKNELEKFPNISVREEAGAKIVKELTGKDAEVLIDPTLMLSKVEWINIEKKPENTAFDKDYILTYFLSNKTDEQQQYIQEIANKNNLRVYNLLDYNQPEIYTTDPGEFIYLIHNAKVVFTDSFHACVFSFIFNKPFQVFPRNGSSMNMMSRINTLLNKFKLQRKLYGYAKNDLFECDYSEGFIQLEKEKRKLMDFLKKSLSYY